MRDWIYGAYLEFNLDRTEDGSFSANVRALRRCNLRGYESTSLRLGFCRTAHSANRTRIVTIRPYVDLAKHLPKEKTAPRHFRSDLTRKSDPVPSRCLSSVCYAWCGSPDLKRRR